MRKINILIPVPTGFLYIAQKFKHENHKRPK